MVVIPVSFMFSFSLVILLIWVLMSKDHEIGFLPKVTLAVLAIQSILIGLRWTYSYTEWTLIQALLAALIPALVLTCLLQLVSARASRQPIERLILHCVPALLILLSPFLDLPVTDFVIIGVFLGYGGALVYIGSKSDMEWRDRVPFRSVLHTNAAFLIAGTGLLLSAFVDIAVSYDMSRNAGLLAPRIVGIANVAVLLLLAGAIVLVIRYMPPHSDAGIPDSDPVAEETLPRRENRQLMQQTLAQMERALIDRRLYRDPDLSLNSLSRKLVIPSRRISTSVNSLRAMNVSQYINLFRITEAIYLLENTDCPITGVMFDVGFNTKSNFNREFRRIVGINPRDWRKERSVPQNKLIDNLRIELQNSGAAKGGNTAGIRT